MSKTLRRVLIMLPCMPGLIMLLAGLVAELVMRGDGAADRVNALFVAAAAVLLAGVAVGAVVAWRIAHPPAEPEE